MSTTSLVMKGCFFLLCLLLAQTDVAVAIDAVVKGSGASLPANAYHDIMLAYSYLHPGITVEYNDTNSKLGLDDITVDTSIFAGSDIPLPSNYFDPNVRQLPTALAGIVPIYNIGNAGLLFNPWRVVFTRQILADIWESKITMWNDPAIVATCGWMFAAYGSALPNEPIQLVTRSTESGTAYIWNEAMRKFSTSYNASIPSSGKPAFPGNNIKYFETADEMQFYVTATPYTLSYAVLGDVRSKYLLDAMLVNKAGSYVNATAQKVANVLYEQSQSISEIVNNNFIVDLHDAAGPDVWPIVGLTYVIIRKDEQVFDCEERANMVDFWYWYYTSSVSTSLIQSLGLALLPDNILAAVQDILLKETLCNQQPAIVNYAITGMGPSMLFNVMNFVSFVYQSVDDEVEQAYIPNDSAEMAQMMLDSQQVDFVFASGFQKLLMDARRTQQIGIEYYKYQAEPFYNAIISVQYRVDACAANPIGIKLSAAILKEAILEGMMWNDYRIKNLNPKVPNLPFTPIKIVIMAQVNDMNYYIIQYLEEMLGIYLDKLNLASVAQKNPNIIVKPLGLMFALEAEVQENDNTLGFVLKNKPASGHIREAYIENKAGQFVLPTIANANSCSYKNAMVLSKDTNPTCYPMGGTFFLITLSNPSSTQGLGTVNTCILAERKALYLNWLFTLEDLPKIAENTYLGTYPNAPVTKMLESLACDDLNLIDAFATERDPEVVGVIYAFAWLGVISCSLTLLFIHKYGDHSVLTSASVRFLNWMLVGLILQYVFPMIAILPNSDFSCTIQIYVFSMGFVFTFGSLFVKAWRVRTIFVQKRVKHVKLSNNYLTVVVAALSAVALVFVFIWSLVAPFEAKDSIVALSATTFERRVSDTTCRSEDGAIFYVLYALMGICLILFGVVIAIQSRNIPSKFNESKWVALSIYNMMMSFLFVIPSLALMEMGSNTIALFLSAAVIWIASGTFILIFLPKMYLVWFGQNGIGGVSAESRSRTSKESGETAFDTSMKSSARGGSTFGKSGKSGMGKGNSQFKLGNKSGVSEIGTRQKFKK